MKRIVMILATAAAAVALHTPQAGACPANICINVDCPPLESGTCICVDEVVLGEEQGKVCVM